MKYEKLNQYVEYLKNTTPISDILYDYAPLITVSKGDNQDFFVFIWVNTNEEKQVHQWLIFSTSSTNLQNYLKKTITQNVFIKNAINNEHIKEKYLLALVNNKWEYLDCNPLNYTDIPHDYLPDENLFFDGNCAGDNGWQKWLMQCNKLQ